MLAGIRFYQLGYGDPLIDRNWSYKDFWGVSAAQEKLLDQFKYANDMGFKIIYDSLCPKFKSDGRTLTLDGSGENSNLWPVYHPTDLNRINIYKQQVTRYNFKFICQLEWPEPINENNMDAYYDFFMKLILDPNYSWIQNWQLSDTPEELVRDNLTYKTHPKVSPQNYIKLLNKIRTSAKLVSANINVGGPGIFKCLGLLDYNNPLKKDDSFYHQWLTEAIDLGLLYNIDFFTLQLMQQTKGLEHDRIRNLMTSLNEIIKSKLNKELPIYSINQGRQELNKNNYDLLKDQAYYNVSEMLNSYKNGAIPIINCMTDPCDNLSLNEGYKISNDGYGILRYDMSKKTQYETFKFVLKELKDFSTLTSPNKIYNNNNVEDITFLSSDEKDIVSVVWSKNKLNQKIVLLPNPDEFCYYEDGTKEKITHPLEWTTSNGFVILKQTLAISIIDYESIKNRIFKQYMYTNKYRNDLLDSVPAGYNKESDFTNFYKILRSFALEFADLQLQVDTLKDNYYLDTAHDTAIYQNFGNLINLEKQSDWDYEKYRRFVQGVMKSLLTGPTVKSIQEAINLFVNYDSIFNGGIKIADIKIHELYDCNDLDPVIYGNIYKQFVFVVEVNKDIDVDINQDILNRDLKYLVNILKPAHTLQIIVVVLSGSEDYKKWYYETHFGKDGLNVEFKDSDELTIEGTIGGDGGKKEGIYGWKHFDYAGQFFTYDPNKKHQSKISSGIYIGPRYILNDTIYEEIILEYIHDPDSGRNLCGEVYLTPLEEPAAIIRYGYYNDKQDAINDQKFDNKIGQFDEYGNPNPDYDNLDSGEYYRNWWLKYKKIEEDIRNKTNINGTNILDNTQYKFVNELDTTRFQTDLLFEDINYDQKPTEYKKLPLLFQLNKTALPVADLIDPIADLQYDMKHDTAPMGVKRLSNNLPPEMKVHEKCILINPNTNEVELGNLPYNNRYKRPYRNDTVINKKLYWEDMDQTPNFLVDLEEPRYGENWFIFRTNISILPTSVPDSPTNQVSPLGFGYNIRDNDLSMEMYKIVGGNKVVVRSAKNSAI